MAYQDEAAQLRRRMAAMSDLIVSLPHRTESGNPALAVRTRTKTTYPTVPSAYYSCFPLAVTGDEVEGGPATLTVAVEDLYVFNVGTVIPPVGTDLLATFVDNRWVVRYDG